MLSGYLKERNLKMAPKKVDPRKKMSERLTMSCTKTEAAMIQDAIEIAERHNVSDYMRSVVIPHAKALVSNQRLFDMAAMFSKPDFFSNAVSESAMKGFEVGLEGELEKLPPEMRDALKGAFGNSLEKNIKKK